ncbi:hypothetical protein ACQ4PT_031837 [Festuca glaucescens]
MAGSSGRRGALWPEVGEAWPPSGRNGPREVDGARQRLGRRRVVAEVRAPVARGGGADWTRKSVRMDNQAATVPDSSDMSISSEEDGFQQQKEGNVELQQEHGEAHVEALLQDPELGMTFDSEDDAAEYYKKYAKSKGFGVTRRSSHTDDDGELSQIHQLD